MGTTFILDISVLVLAGFVGYAVISKVPNTLHTPLMSGTNAIHGVVVLGALLLMHIAHGWLEHVLLVIAVAFGTINVVGGFLVTDRMLGMFKSKEPRRADESDDADAARRGDGIDGAIAKKGSESEHGGLLSVADLRAQIGATSGRL